MEKDKTKQVTKTNVFIKQAIALINAARDQVARQTNSVMVFTYFQVGRLIVEHEQSGSAKAAYGKATINALSIKLTTEFGKGYSATNLEQMRSFYNAFSHKNVPYLVPQAASNKYKNNQIPQTLSEEFKNNPDTQKVSNKYKNNQIPQTLSEELTATSKRQSVSQKPLNQLFPLSWSHYIILSRIENADERSFYETEAAVSNWSVRELQRQFDSSLFERLSLSKNKKKVRQLSTKGQIVEKPEDIFKTPCVLEFLGLDEKSSYTETDMETAIINRLEHFLLEMGKGFLFQGRQVRFSFDEENFFVDLVLYNRLLQCFVLVDLKIGKLKHQDIGQMQMYVNYYDRYVKKEFEQPSIGIIICKDKTDAVVEITLPEGNKQIFATQYKLYLPTKAAIKKLLSD